MTQSAKAPAEVKEVAIADGDLSLADTELYNSGWVEWVATDGTVIRLFDPTWNGS